MPEDDNTPDHLKPIEPSSGVLALCDRLAALGLPPSKRPSGTMRGQAWMIRFHSEATVQFKSAIADAILGRNGAVDNPENYQPQRSAGPKKSECLQRILVGPPLIGCSSVLRLRINASCGYWE